MIQRVQSIFLLLAAASLGVLFVVPFAISNEPDKAFLSDAVYNINDHIIMLVTTILGAAVLFSAIFLFKNRPLQMKLGYVGIVAAILLIAEAIILFYNESKVLSENIGIEEQAGILLPVLAIIFAALANRFIRKDEKLVRSMDRLR